MSYLFNHCSPLNELDYGLLSALDLEGTCCRCAVERDFSSLQHVMILEGEGERKTCLLGGSSKDLQMVN